MMSHPHQAKHYQLGKTNSLQKKLSIYQILLIVIQTWIRTITEMYLMHLVSKQLFFCSIRYRHQNVPVVASSVITTLLFVRH